MLSAIITFQPSYFDCDLQIAVRDEGTGRDIHIKSLPILSLEQQIVAYKPVKYHFQERQNSISYV